MVCHHPSLQVCKDADREGKRLCKEWSEAGLCKTEVEQMMRFCKKKEGIRSERPQPNPRSAALRSSALGHSSPRPPFGPFAVADLVEQHVSEAGFSLQCNDTARFTVKSAVVCLRVAVLRVTCSTTLIGNNLPLTSAKIVSPKSCLVLLKR